jgi:galactokinase
MRAPLLDTLLGAGVDARDADARVAQIEGVVDAHRAVTRQPPAWCWFVPGRIEIFGKHTDYAGGRSLLAAAPRGFVVAASARQDDVVSVCNAGRGETAGVRVSAASAPSGGLRYVAAVARRLALNFPGASLGVDLTIASDLPPSAGLSSSSALVVSAALALIRRAELEARPEWVASIRTPYDLAGYLGAIERGAAFGALAGTSALGVFGGSEDHTAILTCRPWTVSACRFVPVAPLGDAPLPRDWRFVVATSGVAADKAHGARGLYNNASLAADALMGLWRAQGGTAAPSLAVLLSSTPGAAARLEELAESGFGKFSAGALRRRLAHFLAEDHRVPLALAAFGKGSRPLLSDLARDSQEDAELLLQNQTEETSALARMATERGAFAATSFGAGFGGSVWALVDAADAHAFGARWLAAYKARHPQLNQAEYFVAVPGPSVIEIGVRS